MGQNQPLGLSEEENKERTRRKRPRYDSRNQLAFDVLAEFGVAASHAITDIMGEKQAEALVRTEWQNASLASTLNIKNRMAFEGHDYLFLAYAVNFANYIMGLDQKGETTSNGGRWSATSCPWSRATNAICCHLDFVPKSLAEVFAPAYTPLNPKRLSRGDDECLVIMVKEGIDPEQVLEAPCIYEPLPPLLDLEEMVLWNHSYFGGMWAVLMKSIVNEIGPEMPMNSLGPKFNDIGKEFANRFKEEYHVSIDNLDSVANGLFSFHSSFLKNGRMERNSDEFTIITHECPYSGEPPEMCQLFQCFYDGLLEEINPELIMSNSMMMSKGDKTCHWTIRKKEEAVREKAKEEASTDDPAKILAVRYARGELSEEEFDKKMASLRKHGLIK